MVRLVVVISSLFLAACEVGEIPEVTSDGGGSADGMGNGCVDVVSPAAAKHIHAAGGTSNAGQQCLNAGCHAAGTAQPFTFGGTVFTASDGNTAKPGTTIKVKSGATTITAISDEDGNFYGTQTVTFPADTLGTACPTVAVMVSDLQAADADCNRCHKKVGGTTLPIFVQ